ncbi:ASCH domain-containing protein [Gudongella sp. DL1XJH-153]|uniref:ASCH domain-containing protein n=1 Tax=Gudongella sp. DL1XJH-153 TaxID=3409804 RepID=UPI003BB4A768
MMNVDKSVVDMWEDYLESIGEKPEETKLTYESWHFCDNEKDANELIELVLEGTKRATASLHMLYEIEDEKVPSEGGLNILTDWDGRAKCITRDKKVSILPFKDITEEHARIEGEGDKSLEYWRRAHIAFFGRDTDSLGVDFSEDLLVVFEEFEVVYP